MRESSGIYIKFGDFIQLQENEFTSNWAIMDGSPFWGLAINLADTFGFHGIEFHKNYYSDHDGVPLAVKNPFLHKATTALVGINLHLKPTLARLFDQTISFTEEVYINNHFYFNT